MSKPRLPSQQWIDKLYASALHIRMNEDAIAELYPLQEMRTPTHLCTGQEAVPAGVCAALNRADIVHAYYRSHGWYLAKGGDVGRMFGELYGKATGCSRGYGGSMHLIDLEVGFEGTSAIVAGAMPHAVGAAVAFQARKEKRVAITAFGDGATEEGLFQESLMFAALRKLPVLFICENNGLATNTFIQDRQPKVEIYRRAAGFGVESVQVDGNNAFEVFEATQIALERARGGGGPTFIECTTYRMLEHCGHNTDFHLGHRSPAHAEPWKAKDPIAFLTKYVDSKYAADLQIQFKREIAVAVEAARKAPFPTTLMPEGMPCH